MIVELALATGIPVAAWRAECDEVIVTALEVLADQADRANKGR